MKIENLSGNRAQIAIEIFEENKEPLTYKNVSFMIYNEILNIMTCSEFLLENTTKEMAIKSIEYSKEILDEIKMYSLIIQEKLKDGKFGYFFLLDYGKGSIELASEISGLFTWKGK